MNKTAKATPDTSDEMKAVIEAMGRSARAAARILGSTDGQTRNSALNKMADGLETAHAEILESNARDVEAARNDEIAEAMISRLTLTDKKLASMAQCIREVAAQVDPVGQTIEAYDRPNGLRVEKRRVPIGVIGIIYESRPNVTTDAAALCIKSGNATILRGGKEASHTNQVLARVIRESLQSAGLPPDCVQMVETTDRNAVKAMVQAEGLIDLVIPRGGESLIRAVVEQATVPVIKHYKGVCHIYLDRDADADMAVKVAVSAKVDGCMVCNTAECILVHKDIAAQVLPRIAMEFRKAGVQMRADSRSLGLLQDAKLATESDWGREYLDLIVAIRQVNSIDEAISFINQYGSGHTDAIMTRSIAAAERFTTEVDSASVMVNASTRWADGYEYGLGAEIGISTDKLHARGPMGAADLCTYKFIVTGNGHIRR